MLTDALTDCGRISPSALKSGTTEQARCWFFGSYARSKEKE
jgi:hypothetical protein